MLNENAQKWVDALRGGEYPQGQNALANEDSDGNITYCCLGVACELAIDNGVKLDRIKVPSVVRNVNSIGYNGMVGFLPMEVMEWLNLATSNGSYGGNNELADDNDSGATFEEIADIIEREEFSLFGHERAFSGVE